MTERLGLIVTDASPLITLGAARALSCLTMAAVPVFIPDMVYAEVTQDMACLGAEEVVEWVRAHLGQVQIVPTQVFADYQALLGINPKTRSRGRGEQAALEVLGYEIAADQGLRAVLLFEDNDIHAREFVRALPERVTALSTGDLLHELEAAGRIQSSDRILDEAAARGRNVGQQRQPVAGEPARAVLREQLMRRDRPESGQ